MVPRRLRTLSVLAVTGAAVLGTTAQPASAFDFFRRLFGGFHHYAVQPPDPLNAFARAVGPSGEREDRGPATAFCVRTCDGFHFVVHANAGASAAQMCHAFCPGSETRLYSGSNIDTATASDGSRYADLDNAYAYREQFVSGCTCNGRTVFGLARIDVNSDPTLKPGDVVVTQQGLMAFTGGGDKSAEFTPAASYPRFSQSYRDQLAAMRIAPPYLKAPGGAATSSPSESHSAAK